MWLGVGVSHLASDLKLDGGDLDIDGLDGDDVDDEDGLGDYDDEEEMEDEY